MKYSFQHITPTDEDWELIESSYDSTCYHSKKWNVYLKRIGYTPFVVKIFLADSKIGYFVGERIWRLVTLVTAPFEGIGTYTQGLVMLQIVPNEERVIIYKEMAKWLFDSHLAGYFQVDDWQLRQDRVDWIRNEDWKDEILDRENVRYEVRPTLHVVLNRPVEELWSGLYYKSCKYCVNKARKLGLSARIIEQFSDIPRFVDNHYDQLCEVCRKHGVKPKAGQSKSRMMALCESLFPDRVIMMEVVGMDDEGNEQVMSSGIFCIDKGECSYWTGASYQRYQKYCPNELMVWEAMRVLSEKGAGDLNFCGMANYKLKFGTVYAYVPRLIFSKYSWIYDAKNLAKRWYYRSRKLLLKNKL